MSAAGLLGPYLVDINITLVSESLGPLPLQGDRSPRRLFFVDRDLVVCFLHCCQGDLPILSDSHLLKLNGEDKAKSREETHGKPRSMRWPATLYMDIILGNHDVTVQSPFKWMNNIGPWRITSHALSYMGRSLNSEVHVVQKPSGGLA